MNKKEKQYLNELINSGVTLSKKEIKLIEENIFENSETITPYQLNSGKGMRMIRTLQPF